MSPDYLHNHPDFPELIRIVAEEKGIDPSLVEKDYWIIHCLYGLQKLIIKFELKGGTSLSKGHEIIGRFSEDIDIRIEPPAERQVATQPNQTSAEVVREIPYFRAHEEATQEALSIACTGTNKAGHAEIPSDPPNYPRAQLLYAYAIENVLKGLIVANDAAIVDENRISKNLKSHDLIELSTAAGVTVHVEERPILSAHPFRIVPALCASWLGY